MLTLFIISASGRPLTSNIRLSVQLFIFTMGRSCFRRASDCYMLSVNSLQCIMKVPNLRDDY